MIKITHKMKQMKNLLYLISILIVVWQSACKPAEQKTSEETQGGINHVEWAKNATIYEVNIRQYSKEGTFAAFTNDLPHLKELGVDILWLMPIYSIGELNRKGGMGSPYAISDYLAVNPDYGTMDDFKNLVQKAHELDMKVILDWVANHTAWDHPAMKEHPEWYTKDSAGNAGPPAGTDWADVADLNYNNTELRKYMTDALKWWVSNTDIDGYRCDVADMVPADFWDSARVELDSIKPVFMLAEAENPLLHKKAFDMSYGWEFHHVMNEMAKGKKPLTEIAAYVKRNSEKFSANDYRMYFTTNHDENAWNGTVWERLGDAAPAYQVLCYAMPGMPLIYNGQEAGLNKRLSFFEKDAIDWQNGKMDLTELYTKLNLLKQRNIALANGADGGEIIFSENSAADKILSIIRKKENNEIVFLINLSAEKQNITLKNSTLSGEYRDLFSNELSTVAPETNFELNAYGYKVFYK